MMSLRSTHIESRLLGALSSNSKPVSDYWTIFSAMQIRLSHPSSLHCVLLLCRVDCLKLLISWLGHSRTSPALPVSWSWQYVVNTSELQWVGMLKHCHELNASITLLPMRKMLIIDISVCKWLNMSDVVSWSLLLAFGLWLAFKLCPFASFLVLQFPWLSFSTSCHGFSLCFLSCCASCFEHFDLLNSTCWLLPFHRTIVFFDWSS